MVSGLPIENKIRGCHFLFAMSALNVQHSRHLSQTPDDNVGTPARRMAESSHPGTGVPRGGGRPRTWVCTKLIATVAGVAVLFAFYPGRTDMTCQAHCSSTPDKRMLCVWVKILFRVFCCRKFPRSVDGRSNPTILPPWAQRSIRLDNERICRLPKSAA
jgi:hypothetical protein